MRLDVEELDPLILPSPVTDAMLYQAREKSAAAIAKSKIWYSPAKIQLKAKSSSVAKLQQSKIVPVTYPPPKFSLPTNAEIENYYIVWDVSISFSMGNKIKDGFLMMFHEAAKTKFGIVPI